MFAAPCSHRYCVFVAGIAYVLVPVLADASSLLLAITSRSDSDEDSTDGDDENDGNDEYAALPAAAATHAPPPGSPKPARPPRTRRERASLFLSAASLLFATLPAISLVTAPTPSLKYQSLTTAVFLFAQLLRWFAETTTQTLLRAHNAPIHPPRLSLTRNLITLLSLAALSPLLLTVQSWLLRPTTQAADLAFYEPGEILERFEDVKQCIMVRDAGGVSRSEARSATAQLRPANEPSHLCSSASFLCSRRLFP